MWRKKSKTLLKSFYQNKYRYIKKYAKHLEHLKSGGIFRLILLTFLFVKLIHKVKTVRNAFVYIAGI